MEKRGRKTLMLVLHEVRHLSGTHLDSQKQKKIKHLLNQTFKSPKRLLKNFRRCLKDRYALFVYKSNESTNLYAIDTQLLAKEKNNIFESIKNEDWRIIKGEEK